MNKKTSDVPSAFQVLTEIGIINQLATSAFERVLPHGLTISQFGVLNHLVRLGGAWSPLRLANAFQVTKGAMTNTLQKLETRKFVSISPDPNDGRSKKVTLTPKGAKAHMDAVKAAAPFLGDLTTDLKDKNFRSALPFLSELRAYLDQARV